MIVKPFLKWVGGKTQLLEEINRNLPEDLNSIETYIEPFIGGGAVLFDIVPKMKSLKRVIINDMNSKLTNVYSVIKYNHLQLIDKLTEMQNAYYSKDSVKYKVWVDNDEAIGPCEESHWEIRMSDKEQMFYDVRDSFNKYAITKTDSYIEHAAEFIFLNKTCFNGLYRENSNGLFNVPWNKAEKPLICDKDNIIAVHNFLSTYNVTILTGPYVNALRGVNHFGKTFIYFDPPYRPISESSAFTSYTKSGFNDSDQEYLKTCCDKLTALGNYIMLSNSDPKNSNINDNFFDDLYNNYNIVRVNARRNINSKGTARGTITEILVKNY